MGRLTENEQSSVSPLRGRGEQGLASNFVDETTQGEYKPGLLVVFATGIGFEKPWSILIDSGSSSNYVRRRSLEGSQQYAEALKTHDSDSITVRLATGIRVIIPKVPLNLDVKFLDFNSVERCLVFNLDTRYDYIVGSAWLNGHESLID